MAASILVGVDGSPAAQRALGWAAQHAIDHQLTVIAVHVLTYSAEFRHDLPPTGLTTWRTTLRHQLEHAWVQPLRHSGVSYRTALVEDDTVDGGLLRTATDNDVTMIVLGTHLRRNLKDRLVGSVTCNVIHRATQPVVVVPPNWRPPRAPARRDTRGVGLRTDPPW